MADTDNRQLNDALSSRIYYIPNYQRGYVWQDEHIRDLIEDIQYCMGNEISHYLGNIVMEEVGNNRGKKEFNIIDGQQRITTLTLIISNLYWECKELKENIIDTTKLEEPEREKFISKIDTLSTELEQGFLKNSGVEICSENLLLHTAESQKDMYEDIILNSQQLRDYTPTQYSERNLKSVNDEIMSWFSKNISTNFRTKNDVEESVKFIDELALAILSQIDLTEYSVGSQNEAGRIFGVVNDRGRNLNVADKVKSMLVYESSKITEEDESIVNDIHDVFATIYENVAGETGGRKEIDKFMKSHWYIFSNPSLNEGYNIEDLHRIITSKYLDNSTNKKEKYRFIQGYIKSLEKMSEHYRLVTTPDYSGNDTIQSIRYMLNNLSPNSFIGPLMVASRCLNESEEKAVLKSLEKLSLRSHIILKSGSNIYDKGASNASYRIYWMYHLEKGDLDPHKVFTTSKATRFKGINNTTDAVEKLVSETKKKSGKIKDVENILQSTDIVTGKVNWSGLKRSQIRYLLYRIEHERNRSVHLKNLASNTGDEQLTIEHILPEGSCDESMYLGNMILLEREINEQARDLKYVKKVEKYNNSNLDMPKIPVDINRTTWGKTEIEKLENKLINRISNYLSYS